MSEDRQLSLQPKTPEEKIDALFSNADRLQLRRDWLEWWMTFNTWGSPEAAAECNAEMNLGKKSGWKWRLLAKPAGVTNGTP